MRPSFVPPQPIRQLRDLTRYRTEVVRERTRETQRLHNLFEDAGIKITLVVSDVAGQVRASDAGRTDRRRARSAHAG